MADVFLGEGDDVVRQLDALEVKAWGAFVARVHPSASSPKWARTRYVSAGPSAERHPTRARRVWAGCPVRVQCAAYADEHGLTGMWGGMSERQRRRAGPARRPGRRAPATFRQRSVSASSPSPEVTPRRGALTRGNAARSEGLEPPTF
ncbi:MAG: WhiB family transcriptional regulator [Acidimicrobiia bacterium]